MVRLSEDESRHARKVLRVREEDLITVVDGAGGTHRVRVTEVGKKHVVGISEHRSEGEGEPARSLHIGLGILHQPARWETFLEKAVELGCTRVTPLQTERSQTSRLKRHRLEQIMISAMKQSGRSRLPVLDDPAPLDTLLGMEAGIRILCHEASSDARSPGQVLQDAEKDDGVIVLIGPEGGFSDDEVAKAAEAGWETVWLGSRRLRAETAAMTVAAVVSQY